MGNDRRETRDVRQIVTLRGAGAGESGAAGRMLVGYCAMFDAPYDCFDPFFSLDVFSERIDPKAFDRTLREDPDVRALRNHDWDQVLGRTKAGTLRLSADARGLAFELDLPDTTLGRDTREDVRSGNIDGCSFGFIVRDEQIDRGDKSKLVRTILDVDLIEITPACSFPMNPATSVNVRHLGQARPGGRPRVELARRRLALLDLA